jgi:mono/diheme cytochrome c family protein
MKRRNWFVLLTGIILYTGCSDKVSEEKMENGKKVYQTYCQSCHMDNGSGVPPLNAPLVGSKYVNDKNKMIDIVLRGSAALKDEANRSYRNIMPSLAGLDDKEIADVLTFINNSFGNKGPVIDPGEVKSVRK